VNQRTAASVVQEKVKTSRKSSRSENDNEPGGEQSIGEERVRERTVCLVMSQLVDRWGRFDI
jgi:hypothetical protein